MDNLDNFTKLHVVLDEIIREEVTKHAAKFPIVKGTPSKTAAKAAKKAKHQAAKQQAAKQKVAKLSQNRQRYVKLTKNKTVFRFINSSSIKRLTKHVKQRLALVTFNKSRRINFDDDIVLLTADFVEVSV